MSMDAHDGSLDGIEDLDPTEAADANRPYGEVTAEDLATDELVGDGADAGTLVPDEPGVPVDVALHTDEPLTEETIDERVAQEEPDPAADVAYGATADETQGDLPGDADSTVEPA